MVIQHGIDRLGDSGRRAAQAVDDIVVDKTNPGNQPWIV